MAETEKHYVGKRVSRVDGVDKVTGQAVYGFDLELPGMLYGAAVRSPIAHGKIVEIDVSEAMKVPGVKGVVTGKDFPFTFGFAIQGPRLFWRRIGFAMWESRLRR